MHSQIKQRNLKFILGIAKSTDKNSYFEKIAVNSFHGKSKVIKDSDIKCLDMSVPENFSLIKRRNKSTQSFCNYSMFKTKHFLSTENIDIPFYFCHVSENDLDYLLDNIKKLEIN